MYDLEKELKNLGRFGESPATGASKDAEYITSQIIPVIRALPNPLAVDLIIADGASDMVLFRTLISAVFPWIFSMWYISNIANRILAAIGNNDTIEELIRKGKVIVDVFCSSRHFEHSLFDDIYICAFAHPAFATARLREPRTGRVAAWKSRRTGRRAVS